MFAAFDPLWASEVIVVLVELHPEKSNSKPPFGSKFVLCAVADLYKKNPDKETARNIIRVFTFFTDSILSPVAFTFTAAYSKIGV